MKWSSKADYVLGRYKIVATNGMFRATWEISFGQIKNAKLVKDVKKILRGKVTQKIGGNGYGTNHEGTESSY
jgi:hypothetical protein